MLSALRALRVVFIDVPSPRCGGLSGFPFIAPRLGPGVFFSVYFPFPVFFGGWSPTETKWFPGEEEFIPNSLSFLPPSDEL